MNDMERDALERDRKRSTIIAALVGFGAGAIVGTITALLYAPSSGLETREKIKDKFADVQDRATDVYSTAKDKATTAYSTAKDKASTAYETVVEKTSSAIEKAKEKFTGAKKED
jgi:gas vesicle protein